MVRPLRFQLPRPMLNRTAVCCLCLCFGTWVGVVQADDDAGSAADGVAYFETHIRPLLIQRCYGCHSQPSGKREGGLLLDSVQGWQTGGETGTAIVAKDPDASLLIQAVRYANEDLQMPPTERLPAEAIARLEHWVKLGAPAPVGDPAAAATMVSPADPIAGQQHWAFQPLGREAVPEVTDVPWPKSDIDRFVLARLEADELRPVGDAEPGDLVRRLCFQLTGLPPTTEQLQRFVNEPSPAATERLVDELLRKPQFGERWGRHWLDLARYADSNGLDENFLFREAWRYRNWVIAAVNSDIPFDRFLLEQLAGDLLPFDTIEQRDQQRVASGFLVMGPKVLLGVNPDLQKMDVADEQLETIGRVVLGQTLGCARCHDHKFDPIPTKDYYALAGIMTSTQVMEQRYMLGQQRVMERLAGLGPDGDALNAAYEKYWREHPGLQGRIDRAKSVLETLKQKDEAAITAKLSAVADDFSEAARDAVQAIDQRIASQEAHVNQLQESLAKPPGIPARAMIPAEISTPVDEHVRLAGQFDRPGDKIPRGFLQVLCDDQPVPLPESQSGRLELSRWLTDGKTRTGWLTARVQVNRIWHHLMGRGLVRTVDNFGRTGEAPSHPELLDHLATQLIDSGWSMKTVIRSIVLSRTFGLSSQHVADNFERDPDNRLLWKAHRRRLDPESLRDAMLTAAGTLDLKPMDSTVAYLGDQATAVGGNENRRRTDFPCRSVYLPIIRNDLPELFDVFDFANPHTTTGARPQTTVPTQALYLLNDPMVMDAAMATAKRILAETPIDEPRLRAQVRRMFQLIVSSEPAEEEVQAMTSYLYATTQRLIENATAEPPSEGTPSPETQALALACHALFASSRFQYLE